ncbi:hypothetical protein N7539_001310 [Penicillium diatomitis]|uniref:Uncharacterized protein n=1 Tax=Penicillium diatomitis TaxID=2819901 RepID=A0A9X0C027_9EURO|nr:uncharacterized protein N7539_001310 [Penicillium diatomitis]KAJ5492564.1 hypothetical protein N7539_001310 [Penicillium diatomitis]
MHSDLSQSPVFYSRSRWTDTIDLRNSATRVGWASSVLARDGTTGLKSLLRYAVWESIMV